MPNEQQSETPETDAFQPTQLSWQLAYSELTCHARSLEKRLNEAKAKLDKICDGTGACPDGKCVVCQLVNVQLERDQLKTWSDSEIARLKSLNEEAIREHVRMAAHLAECVKELAQFKSMHIYTDRMAIDSAISANKKSE